MTMRSFESAFDSNCSGCRRRCACGREFFDGYNDGYDWEEGEFDKLRADPKATELPHSVGVVEFDGLAFVLDCDCWHKRAERIIGWMNDHAHQIAEYLSLEKERKQEEADASPLVRDVSNQGS